MGWDAIHGRGGGDAVVSNKLAQTQLPCRGGWGTWHACADVGIVLTALYQLRQWPPGWPNDCPHASTPHHTRRSVSWPTSPPLFHPQLTTLPSASTPRQCPSPAATCATVWQQQCAVSKLAAAHQSQAAAALPWQHAERLPLALLNRMRRSLLLSGFTIQAVAQSGRRCSPCRPQATFCSGTGCRSCAQQISLQCQYRARHQPQRCR